MSSLLSARALTKAFPSNLLFFHISQAKNAKRFFGAFLLIVSHLNFVAEKVQFFFDLGEVLDAKMGPEIYVLVF